MTAMTTAAPEVTAIAAVDAYLFGLAAIGQREWSFYELVRYVCSFPGREYTQQTTISAKLRQLRGKYSFRYLGKGKYGKGTYELTTEVAK
jgi:hypothetical protein